jgi:purine-nucleoside phosphorylase
MLIDSALRGEGTSGAYVPQADLIEADSDLIATLLQDLDHAEMPILHGRSWTTDAPFRETETALAIARSAGARVVEMEAAALYALSQARGHAIACFAHVTNTMAVNDHDFEKGPASGAEQALALIAAVSRGLSRQMAGATAKARNGEGAPWL